MAKREFVRFTSDDEVRTLGEGMMARTLPKARWTHAAHWSTTLWLLTQRPEILPERDLPALIRAYNESVGGQNTDTAGYHETITQASIRAARAFLRGREADEPLFARCNALMETELGDPDWLLEYWAKETLFSVEARKRWLEPDKRDLGRGEELWLHPSNEEPEVLS
jgi:hypothetical protein